MRSKAAPLFLLGILLSLLVCIGCSHGGATGPNPLTPGPSGDPSLPRSGEAQTSHSLLGLYEFTVVPDGPEIRTVPLRDAMFHLNALRFLEPPPPVRIVLSNFQFDGQTVDVDVQLVHPFAGLPQFTGFDVCGIVITSGSISGFSDPDLVVAGEGDTRLLNPDGLTRWWNPREFPYNSQTPMWGYINGNKGTPDETAHYTATLNGYKYHADGLGPSDELVTLNPSTRGSFTAGSAHTRHYKIRLDAGLVFNYAVDACWLPPDETPPIIVPDSFPPSANRDEPWLMTLNVTDNTLYYDPSAGSGGGELGLDVSCYDWFNADQNTVRAECPGVFQPATSSVPVGGNSVYSTYHVDLTNPVFTSDDPIDVWLSAEAGTGYDGLLPGKPTAAYLPPLQVDVELLTPQQGIVLEWGPEGVIDHANRIANNDIDPAVIVDGNGEVLIAFVWYYWSGALFNRPLFSRSTDQGHTFNYGEQGYWQSHSVDADWKCWNSKYTLGSDGQAFHSYWAPCGHTLHKAPWGGTYPDVNGGSHSGPVMEHAGEMLYTAQGYPMMFGDNGGTIIMRRGDYPNVAGTGTWPSFQGTPYTLVAEGTSNYLSLARSAMKTSDGLCHLIFWHEGLPYIRMVSTTDVSGQNWGAPVPVFEGLAEIWVGAKDPSLWIDKNDGFHTSFAAEDWMGNYHLMYGYSATVDGWDEGAFKNIMIVPIADGLNDTHVVVFDAFDETYVFLSYETAGNVWCRYKKFEESEFSDPIQVNEHFPARLPDIYPNGGTGAVFAYEADDGTGNNLTDIFYRLAEFKEE